jgi:hypothetical protein
MRGEGRLNEHIANYAMLYQDGTELQVPIRRSTKSGAWCTVGVRTASRLCQPATPSDTSGSRAAQCRLEQVSIAGDKWRR